MQLAGIGEKLVPALDRVRAQLRGDAIRHGRLRRWRRGKRTPHGEQLLRQTQVFRRELRAQALTAGDGIPAALAPYAMIFGLDPASAVPHIATGGSTTDRRDDIQVPWARLDRFVQAWQQVCADEAGSGHVHRSGNTRSDDFAHQWSAPHGHDHGSHGHDAGHGGYGGYGHDGSGHGGFGHAGP